MDTKQTIILQGLLFISHIILTIHLYVATLKDDSEVTASTKGVTPEYIAATVVPSTVLVLAAAGAMIPLALITKQLRATTSDGIEMKKASLVK